MDFTRTDTDPKPAILLLVSSEDLIAGALERLGLSADETITLDPATVWDRRWREVDKQKVYVGVFNEHLNTEYVTKVWSGPNGMPMFDWTAPHSVSEYEFYYLTTVSLPYFFGTTLIDDNGDVQDSVQANLSDEFDVVLTETTIDAWLNKFAGADIANPYDPKAPVPPGGEGGLLDQAVAAPIDNGDENLI